MGSFLFTGGIPALYKRTVLQSRDIYRPRGETLRIAPLYQRVLNSVNSLIRANFAVDFTARRGLGLAPGKDKRRLAEMNLKRSGVVKAEALVGRDSR